MEAIRWRPGRISRPGSVVAAILLTAFACVSPSPEPGPGAEPTRGSTGPEASTNPHPSPPNALEGLELRLARVATVKTAVSLAELDEYVYVASRRGIVYRLTEDASQAKIVMDLSNIVSCCDGEQGMFALTFSPRGTDLYVSFTDSRGDLHVAEVPVDRLGEASVPRRDLLVIPQPTVRHHGGALAFGPDGYLYLGVGDGSLGSDPTDEAQTLGSLRGKLLRIDPRPSDARPYRIPASNPFVDTPGARPEIYAYGLRNPWRLSFDRATGDLWIGDVGQYAVEEIDFLPAGAASGANLGWNRLEGSVPFSGKPPQAHVPPIFEYSHEHGRCAVIGGYVYRGTQIPALGGAYLFADLCDGRIRAIFQRGGQVVKQEELPLQLDGLASFGEDAEGEIYLLSLFRGVYRLAPAG